ncbi:MAG: hypothetical protein K6U74_00530 [Firmicutes bacterium]|nr:hypothetical protein [Bacillota bacterium]
MLTLNQTAQIVCLLALAVNGITEIVNRFRNKKEDNTTQIIRVLNSVVIVLLLLYLSTKTSTTTP